MSSKKRKSRDSCFGSQKKVKPSSKGTESLRVKGLETELRSSPESEPPPLDAFDPSDSSVDFLADFLCPLLQKGKDQYLFKWMLDFKLLKRPEKCNKQDCNSLNIQLTQFNKVLGRDTHHWKCNDCKRSMPIRMGSVFAPLNCSIPQAMFSILGWSKGTEPELIQNLLEIKLQTIKRIYQSCMDVMECYMKEFNNTIVLGGRSSVVLMDVWPNGYIQVPADRIVKKRGYKDRVRILWLADTLYTPVRFWAHILPPIKPLQMLLSDEGNPLDESFPESDPQNMSLKDVKEVEIKQEIDLDNLEETQNCSDTKSDSRQIRLDRRQILRENQLSNEDIIPPKQKAKPKIMEEIVEDKREESRENIKRRKKSLRDLEREKKSRETKEKEEQDRKKELLDAVLSVVNDRIAPGSYVVANERAIPDIVSVLSQSERYEAVRSFDDLFAAESQESAAMSSVASVLDNIWQTAFKVCREVKKDTRLVATYKLTEFQWRQYFSKTHSQTVSNILSQIASHFVPQATKSDLSSSNAVDEN